MDRSTIGLHKWPENYSQTLAVESSRKKGHSPHVSIVDRWKKQLNADWIETEVVQGHFVTKLTCRVCKQFSSFQNIGTYVTGTSNVKKSSVLLHMKSDVHQQAIIKMKAHLGQ